MTSAVGGAVAGALADALGRVRVLILSIASYALFTLLAGCAQSYEQLPVFLTLQGLGFGGEWAAGAVLVAEYADATQRGRVVGSVQSAWSIGYAGVLLANTITFSLAPPELAWRIMFWLGALPVVALLWVRTGIEESPLYRAEVAARARVSFEIQDDRHWRASVKIPLGMGGLKLNFNFEKLEERPIEYAKLSSKGQGVGAIVAMETQFHLAAEGDRTHMRWEADVASQARSGASGSASSSRSSTSR